MFAEFDAPPTGFSLRELLRAGNAVLPGLFLCVAIAAAAVVLQSGEQIVLGRSWIDAPVLAIVGGDIVRAFWKPVSRVVPGISFSAHMLLEVAIVLLGATLSAGALMAVGPALLAGIAAVVALSLAASYGISTLFGLSRRTAVLIASGNSICGNSAIMAVAPIVGARSQDVACAIAFTALVGVVVVILLPLLGIFLALSEAHYGILAGLTVYAVPQVLAATASVGALAIEVGTIVKLARVVMLGPVCIVLSLLAPRFGEAGDAAARPNPPFRALLPWFVVGFLAMAALRSAGLIPAFAVPALAETSKALTVVSLVALGLGVDFRAALRAGPRVTAAAVASVLILGLSSFALIAILAA